MFLLVVANFSSPICTADLYCIFRTRSGLGTPIHISTRARNAAYALKASSVGDGRLLAQGLERVALLGRVNSMYCLRLQKCIGLSAASDACRAPEVSICKLRQNLDPFCTRGPKLAPTYSLWYTSLWIFTSCNGSCGDNCYCDSHNLAHQWLQKQRGLHVPHTSALHWQDTVEISAVAPDEYPCEVRAEPCNCTCDLCSLWDSYLHLFLVT